MTSLPASHLHLQEWLGIAKIDWWRTLVIRFSAVSITITTSLLMGCQSLPPERTPLPLIEGVVWQLDNETLDARGNWHEIGAKSLLVQWISVDGISFMHDQKNLQTPQRPDWQRIGAEPWAKEVILGLAGRFDESSARADVAGLITESARLAKLPTPLHVLWISVYDNRNIGATDFARWLSTWLPADIGVFFQDGVGVHARTAPVARQYTEAVSRQLGASRVKVIAEAFRPKPEGGFRSATLDELSAQLSVYRGLPVYIFDGPHYVSNKLVDELKTRFKQ
jgi:hypothetical protein